MTDVRTIPLDQLRFGHEAEPPINARKTGREAEVEALAASIDAHGLGQALNVRDIGGVIYVADGNRRLSALRLNAGKGLIAADAPIKVDLDDAGAGDELSLALNFEREPMHEADIFEKMRELHERGLSEEAIASRFGIDRKRVRRMLALGKLAPVVLEAWRAGDVFPLHQVTECIRAFTLAANTAEQERVFKRLNTAGSLYPHVIRQELGAGDREAGKLLTFVGRAPYEAAGGHVVEDLFGTDHVLSDKELVVRLAQEKLAAKREALLADGWSWAALEDELDYGWSWSWEKLGLSKKKAAAEDKARSGCVLRIEREGNLAIDYGVVKPSRSKSKAGKASTGDGAPAEKAEPTVSNALAHRLSVQLTLAVQQALPADPEVALAAMLAGLSIRSYDTPVKVEKKGLGAYEAYRDSETFEDVFNRFCAMPLPEMLAAVGPAMAKAIDLQSHNTAAPPLENMQNQALLGALDGDAVTAAVAEHFDAGDYFGGVPKPLVLRAIGEALNADEARKAGKLKKPELVAFAIENVVPTGWLPPELRTVHYDGPGLDAVLQEAAE